jgi:hypothetical protein
MVRFFLTIFAVIGLCLSSSALAQNAGRWYNSVINDCNVFAEGGFQSAVWQGACRTSRASGYGSVSLYQENDLRRFYEGFYVDGLYISEGAVAGQMVNLKNTTYFLHNPRSRQLRVYSAVVLRARGGAACSDRLALGVTLAEGITLNQDSARVFAEAGIQNYNSLCGELATDGSIPALNISFYNNNDIRNLAPLLATAIARWNGTTWSVESVRVGRTTPNTNNADVNLPLSMEFAVVVSRIISNNNPTCQIAISVSNKANQAIQQLGISVVARTADGAVIQRFQLVRDSSLGTGSRVILRQLLPLSACNLIRTLEVDRVACRYQNKVYGDCKPAIIPVSGTAGSGEQAVNGVRVYY